MKRLRRSVDAIRYEDGAWPLWRWGSNLRYVAKSLLHVRAPHDGADAAHFAAVHDYVERSGLARGAVDAPLAAGARDAGVTLAAVGDMMWIRSGYRDCLSAGVRAALAGADLALANLETPVDPRRPSPRWAYETLHYNAPPEYLQAWQGLATRRVFSLCNNHALDQGAGGLARTRGAVLADPARACVGGPGPTDAIAGVTARGVRIGVFGFTYGINHCEGPAPAGVPVVCLGSRVRSADWARVRRLVEAARAAGPDLVIALPHWGFEYEYWPDARVRADALRLVELGVDLVLGSSPHVLQPIEPVSIDGADPRCPAQVSRGGAPRMGLIAYSLGNFLSIMPTLACRTGVVLRLGLGRARGAWGVARVEAVPTFCGRGVGRERWLDAGVVTLNEAPAAEGALAHARTMLGSALVP
jgi:capsule synthesis protein PGA_cap